MCNKKKVWYISGDLFEYMQNSSILSLQKDDFGCNKVMNRGITFFKFYF